MEKKRKLIPPVYLLITLVAMVGLHWLVPLARLIEPPYSYLGVPFLLAGICVTASAARAFQKAGTSVVPFEPSTVLVTDGLYRYTRNPMYLGLALIALGAWVVLGTLSALLPIAVFVGIIEYHFIRAEERFLESIFGGRYLDYKGRVRRWIGRTKRIADSG
jgi:protein-S-isoprenylcysteine O-methyltransferase Ste14